MTWCLRIRLAVRGLGKAQARAQLVLVSKNGINIGQKKPKCNKKNRAEALVQSYCLGGHRGFKLVLQYESDTQIEAKVGEITHLVHIHRYVTLVIYSQPTLAGCTSK